MIRHLLTRHAEGVIRRPGLAVAAVLAVTALAAMGLARFRVDPDIGALLPRDHPAAQLLKATAEGQDSRTLWILLRGEDLAAAVPRIVARLEGSSFLDRVEARPADLLGRTPESFYRQASATDLERLHTALGDEARRAALQASRALLVQDPIVGRQMVIEDPFGLRWTLDELAGARLPDGADASGEILLLEHGRLALLRVIGARDPFDAAFSRALLADLAVRIGTRPWEAVGGYDFAARDAHRIRGDLVRSISTSVPLILIVLAWATRSLWTPLLYVTPVALAVLAALGIGAVLLGPLPPLAVSAAAILLGVGVDFAIHYLDRYREERARSDHAMATLKAHRGAGPALTLGGATTTFAFVGASAGAFTGLASFGILLAVGLVAAWAATLTLLPVLASAAPTSPAPPTPAAVRGAARIAASPAARPVATLVVFVGLAGWYAAAAGGLRFDPDPSHLRSSEDGRFARLAPLESALGRSLLGLRAWVPADRAPDEIAAALEELTERGPFVRATGAFEGWPGPTRTAAIARLAAVSDDWLERAEVDLTAAGFRPAPFRDGLQAVEDQLQIPEPRLDPATLRWGGRDWRAIDLERAEAPEGFAARERSRLMVREALGGDVLLVDRAGLADGLRDVLATDLRRALLVSGGLVLLLLSLALKQARDVVAVLLPVGCGLGAALGVIALGDVPLHPGNFLALPLVLSLGVDDGIHIVLRARRDGIHRAVIATGGPVWRTTVTTCLGFGSLVFAESPVIASLGWITAAGAVFCLLATLLVVPVLLSHRQTPRENLPGELG